MQELCDFQGQVNLDEFQINERRRAKSTMKYEIKLSHCQKKGFLPTSVGFLNNDLKNDMHIRSFQRKVIPIQSILPSLKPTRNSKSSKFASQSKRTSQLNALNRKKSFMKPVGKSNDFYIFHNFFLQSLT